MKKTTGLAKRCTALALAAVMAVSLAGCKGNSGGERDKFGNGN